MGFVSASSDDELGGNALIAMVKRSNDDNQDGTIVSPSSPKMPNVAYSESSYESGFHLVREAARLTKQSGNI
jgi:hypothetical protein